MIRVVEEEWHRHPILYSLLAVLLVLILLAGVLVIANDIIAYVRSLS